MKIIIGILDSEANFGMRVLKSPSFVKKAKHISVAGLTLLGDLSQAAEEVRLHNEGKIVLQTAKDFLNEL